MKKFTYRHTLFACYLAFITQAIVVNFAPICFVIFQTSYDLSFSLVGQLILFNFATQMVTDIIAMKYADRIGHRKVMLFGHGCIVAGFVLMAILPQLLPWPYLGLVVSVMIYSIGGGIIEVLGSPIVDNLPADQANGSMSLLHSFYCWGQVGVVLITTLLLSVLGDQNWYWIPLLWVIIPCFNLYLFAHVPLVPPHADGVRTPVKKLLSSRLFWVFLLMMFCAGAAELTMSQWASLFAETGLGVSKVLGDLLGPCLFAVFMGIGRTVFGIMGDRLNTRNWLMTLSVLCMICYLTCALSGNAIVALLACAITGFSICLMWPGTFTLASARFPVGGTAMFGMMAVFGDLGCSTGPWLTGIISDVTQTIPAITNLSLFADYELSQIGLKTGFLFATIFPILMFVAALLLEKKRPAKDD